MMKMLMSISVVSILLCYLLAYSLLGSTKVHLKIEVVKTESYNSARGIRL